MAVYYRKIAFLCSDISGQFMCLPILRIRLYCIHCIDWGHNIPCIAWWALWACSVQKAEIAASSKRCTQTQAGVCVTVAVIEQMEKYRSTILLSFLCPIYPYQLREYSQCAPWEGSNPKRYHTKSNKGNRHTHNDNVTNANLLGRGKEEKKLVDWEYMPNKMTSGQ